MNQSSKLPSATKGHKKDASHSQSCYCGCGIIFLNRVDFKNHVKARHRPYFIEGSSHYLTHLTEIVLPVRFWKMDMMKEGTVIQEEAVREQPYEETKEEISQQQEETYEVMTRARKPKPGMQRNKRQNNRQKEDQEKRNAKKGGVRLAQETSQKIMEWNGFIIKPKSVREESGFYCGKCESTFSDLDEFVHHSFDVCQEIDHPKSSHAITMMECQFKGQIMDNNNAQTGAKSLPEGSKNPPAKVIRKRMTSTSVDVKKIPFDTIPQGAVIPEKKDLYDFLAEETQATVFSCGCGRVIRSALAITSSTWNHIARMHQEVVPDNSSHVFLQKQVHNKGRICFLSVDLPSNDKNWFCPCRPKATMSKEQFVNHLRYIHKGVSPLYKLEHFLPEE